MELRGEAGVGRPCLQIPTRSRPLFRSKTGQFSALKVTSWVSNFGIKCPAVNGEILMPEKRGLTMRQLRQMLRLAGSGTSSREIAVILEIARSTVQDNVQRAAAVGLTWPCRAN